MADARAQINKPTGNIRCDDIVVNDDIILQGEIRSKNPLKSLVIDAPLELTGNLKVAGNLEVKGETVQGTYDYVVVGLGSTGSIIARKLSDTGKSVLVLERGKNNVQQSGVESAPVKDTGTFLIATNAVPVNFNPELSFQTPWCYLYPVQLTATRTQSNYSEGCGWGGGGAHMYMNAFRGTTDPWNDYDAASGNTGKWTYNTLLPYMMAFETYTPRSGAVGAQRGTSGPTSIVQQADMATITSDPLVIALANTADVGVGFNTDLNNGDQASSNGRPQVGFSAKQMFHKLPFTTAGGTSRVWTQDTFLPIDSVIDENGNGLNGRKLKIVSNAFADRVLFEGNRAVGVEYIPDANLFDASTRVAFNATFPFGQTLPLAGATIPVVSTVAPFTPTGRLTINGFYNVTYTGVTLSPAVATVTAITTGVNPTVYTAANTFTVGQSIVVAGVDPVQYNGTFIVSAASATTFSVAQLITGPYVSGGTATATVRRITAFTGCTSLPNQTGTITANMTVTGDPGYYDGCPCAERKKVYGKEIILSAGCLTSPQILQRSGVGNATLLNALDIPVVVNNPNVGANMAPHLQVQIRYAAPLAYTNPSQWVAFSTDLSGIPAPYDYPTGLRRYNSLSTNLIGGGIAFFGTLYAGKSRGTVAITSKNPFATAAIDFGLFNDPGSNLNPPTNGSDVNKLVAWVKTHQKMATDNGYTLTLPTAPDLATDLTIANYIRNNANTQQHQVGTCRLGTSIADGVVNADLQVFGTTNLYVSDVSVYPVAINGNLQFATFMAATRLLQALSVPVLPLL
jgi:choline dehydrogenase-like flavoprotein